MLLCAVCAASGAFVKTGDLNCQHRDLFVCSGGTDIYRRISYCHRRIHISKEIQVRINILQTIQKFNASWLLS